jgi:hypothetical protein
MDLFGAVCKLEWVWDDGVDMCHNRPFKVLPDYRCECYRAVVIVAGSLRVLPDYRCEYYRAVVIVAGSLKVLENRNDGG